MTELLTEDKAAFDAMYAFYAGFIKALILNSPEDIFKNLDGVEQATQVNEESVLGCIDERFGHRNYDIKDKRFGHRNYGIAGSGILQGRKATLDAIKRGKVKQITSHKHCGAAIKYVSERREMKH